MIKYDMEKELYTLILSDTIIFGTKALSFSAILVTIHGRIAHLLRDYGPKSRE